MNTGFLPFFNSFNFFILMCFRLVELHFRPFWNTERNIILHILITSNWNPVGLFFYYFGGIKKLFPFVASSSEMNILKQRSTLNKKQDIFRKYVGHANDSPWDLVSRKSLEHSFGQCKCFRLLVISNLKIIKEMSVWMFAIYNTL